MTLTQSLFAKKANRSKVSAGELLMLPIDLALGNDITAPPAIDSFYKFCGESDKVFDPNKIALVLDHFTPCKDIASATQCAVTRKFAHAQGITHFYDVGEMGIEHALLPEKGLTKPGQIIIGADSHTCTYGAVGAFSTGVGSSDLCYAMKTGKLWFKVPAGIRVELIGKPAPYLTGKDVILHLIAKIGVDGALYRSLEFCGDSLPYLDIDDRFTIANMAIEAGAKNGIFPVDERTIEYLNAVTGENFAPTQLPDEGYERVITLDLSQMQPIVAFPHLPSMGRVLSDIEPLKIEQVVIGSCTNGRISDLRRAAAVLKGKKVRSGVRCLVIPATNAIYLQALREGLIEIFISAGAVVSTPTCGPCLGGHMGILAEGERALSTTNRNFVGRMGHPKSEVYLCSPVVAAVGAVLGSIPNMRDFTEVIK